MSRDLSNFMLRDFRKVKKEAQRLIENGTIDLTELDKKIILIRNKILKQGKMIPSEITMNDRYVHLANKLIRDRRSV